jgi:hypothetical protein
MQSRRWCRGTRGFWIAADARADASANPSAFDVVTVSDAIYGGTSACVSVNNSDNACHRANFCIASAACVDSAFVDSDIDVFNTSS